MSTEDYRAGYAAALRDVRRACLQVMGAALGLAVLRRLLGGAR